VKSFVFFSLLATPLDCKGKGKRTIVCVWQGLLWYERTRNRKREKQRASCTEKPFQRDRTADSSATIECCGMNTPHPTPRRYPLTRSCACITSSTWTMLCAKCSPKQTTEVLPRSRPPISLKLFGLADDRADGLAVACRVSLSPSNLSCTFTCFFPEACCS